VRDVVGSPDVLKRFVAVVAALDGLAPLMGVSLNFGPIFTPRALARSLPSPVRARINSRSNSASPPRTVNIRRPCAVVVPAHVSLRDLNPAFFAVIAASVLRRSRVDRARRSRRVTISTSPLPSWSSAWRNCARSARAPLAVSRKTFSAPAARNCFTCASTLWPSVDTRA